MVVNGELSDWSDVVSGVLQGSVLGPLYFILFINDLPEFVHNAIALFADDAKIFSVIKSLDDHKILQNDLVLLQEWADKWKLYFNTKKCKVLHLGLKNLKYLYTVGDETIEPVSEQKDLGVILDDNLKLHLHTEHQVNKANRILGFIKRTFDTLDKSTFKLLYMSLVRPHLLIKGLCK